MLPAESVCALRPQRASSPRTRQMGEVSAHHRGGVPRGGRAARSGLVHRSILREEVRKLAHKHHVPIEEFKIAGLHDVLDALKTLPPATEHKCVAASLATIETGMPRLIDRAQAWAIGDVSAHPEPARIRRGGRLPRGHHGRPRRGRPLHIAAPDMDREYGASLGNRRRHPGGGEHGHVARARRLSRCATLAWIHD